MMNLWCKMRIYNYIRYGIKNIFRWFSTIWSDRNWDSYFLYKILRKKLSLMEDNFRKYGYGINSERNADKIHICVLLLDRLINDNYIDLTYKNFYKKYGEPEFKFEKIDNGEYSRLVDRTDEILTKKELERKNKEFRRLTKHEGMLKKQDIDYLFKLMRKHIEGWWD